MKKRFEIYLDTEELQLIEQLKHDTGHKKPGMAIAAAIYSYFRYQDTSELPTPEGMSFEH